MWLNTFNYVASALSIISFVITLTPFFPRYKTYVRYLTVFFIGTLFGSIFSHASAQNVEVQFAGSLLQLLLLVGAIVTASIVILVILGIAIGGEAKEAHAAAGVSAGALFILMMLFYGISQLGGGPSYRGRDIDELLALARYYKDQGNRNLALEYYYKALDVAASRVKPDMKNVIEKEAEALAPKK